MWLINEVSSKRCEERRGAGRVSENYFKVSYQYYIEFYLLPAACSVWPNKYHVQLEQLLVQENADMEARLLESPPSTKPTRRKLSLVWKIS